MTQDFSTVTELPGTAASAEQLSMIHTRYRFALERCAGKDVLEVACGPGRGLGMLSKAARSVIGGDYTAGLVDLARAYYGDRIDVRRLDAHDLPFAEASFDVVILFEAVYYLDAARFLAEARRVLRPGGELVLCMPNPEWAEFNPSPFSTRYFTSDQARTALREAGFAPRIFGAFEAEPAGTSSAIVGTLRRAAVSLGVIPKTMKGKALLKRLFYGPLARLGPEVDTTAPARQLVELDRGPVAGYKVLYAVARRLA